MFSTEEDYLERIRNTRILVVGDLMIDRYWEGSVNKISPEAPVPILHYKTQEDRLGGASNVAANLSALQASVSLIGITGHDENYYSFQELLQEKKIDSFIYPDQESQTTVKLRVLAKQQQIARIDFESNQHSLEALQYVWEKYQTLLPTHDAIILSDYNKGCLGAYNINKMIQYAHLFNKKVFIDPKGNDFSPYSGAYAITPNLKEIQNIIGDWKSEKDLLDKVKFLRKRLDLHLILLTRSQYGLSLITPDEIINDPGQSLEIFDVSGAGDSVIAMFALASSIGIPLAQATYWANISGHLSVQKRGVYSPSWKEISLKLRPKRIY